MKTEIYCSVKNKKHSEYAMVKSGIGFKEDINNHLKNEMITYIAININVDQVIALTSYCVIQTTYTKNPIHGAFRSLFIHDFY